MPYVVQTIRLKQSVQWVGEDFSRFVRFGWSTDSQAKFGCLNLSTPVYGQTQPLSEPAYPGLLGDIFDIWRLESLDHAVDLVFTIYHRAEEALPS